MHPAPSQETRDIGALLKCTRSRPAEHSAPSDTREASEDKEGSMLEIRPENTQPVTTGETHKQNLQRNKAYDRIRLLFDADIALVKTEVQAFTDCIQATEEVVNDLKQGLAVLGDTVQQMHTSHSFLTHRLDALDDRSRRPNIKICGVSDAVSTEELPHFIRRLIATALPAKQDKMILLDGAYRVNRSPCTPAVSPRDIILKCQTFADKQKLMKALQEKAF
ncbi:Hypothetical predicted protein [Pelobates cultripes]|uniref:Uncharacterized protein n=1 Tax=Pelobates cultripes TaxID=61616 RepID=A0AAD1RN78_PELCU|nr:Hypothetical predicted protein [Pelobates cultripes]